ncbi:MAG: lysophospholipid acyltransferase family protein [Holophaga sp.]|jgi:1-acyl-sn-glycerol-3-phosphate acyltransferase
MAAGHLGDMIRSKSPFPPLHPWPALRLAATLGGTLWAIGELGRTRTPGLSAHAWARRTLRLMGVEARLTAPIPAGAQVWVSNHLSWLDPLVYLSLRPSRAMAKAEVAAYPFIGRGASRIGLRFVDRNDPFSRAAALMGMVRDLRAGEDFLLFPEGTTTRGDRLAPLCQGGLRMAYRLGARLLPFRLSSSDPHYPWIGDDALVPHLKRLARSRTTQVRVHPGQVLDPAQWRSEEAWLQAIRDHLAPGSMAA